MRLRTSPMLTSGLSEPARVRGHHRHPPGTDVPLRPPQRFLVHHTNWWSTCGNTRQRCFVDISSRAMSELTSTGRRRELGSDLRHLREHRGFNGTEMASRLKWTSTMLSRAETSKRPMTEIEVATYTGVCGVTGAEQDVLLDLAREPDDYRLKPHLGQLPDQLRSLIFHEATASRIESYQPIFIPGVTQTEGYARGPRCDHALQSGALHTVRARERASDAGRQREDHERADAASALREQSTAVLRSGGSHSGWWPRRGARVVPDLQLSRGFSRGLPRTRDDERVSGERPRTDRLSSPAESDRRCRP